MLFDVLVSLVFYLGTSYLMNVHFGSKGFHLSCFGVSLRKKPNNTNNTRTTFLHVRRSFIDSLASAVFKKKQNIFHVFRADFCHSLLGASCGLDWRWSDSVGTSETFGLAFVQTDLRWTYLHSSRQTCVEHICILTDSILWKSVWRAFLLQWMMFQMIGNLLGTYQKRMSLQGIMYLQLRSLQVYFHLQLLQFILALRRLFRFLQHCFHRALQRSYPHQILFLIQVADLQRMMFQHFTGKVQGFIVHHHISLQICSREWMTDLFVQGTNLKVLEWKPTLRSRYTQLVRQMM